MRSARRRRAFTLIEVMMAIAVMTVGALGVMALQQAATRGNMEARQMSTATQIARTWVERLRRDSVNWNQAGMPSNTRHLVNAPAPGVAEGPWMVPASRVDANNQLESNAFDYFGNDTDIADEMVYCTHVRYGWLVPGQALRAEVRIFWPRRDARAPFSCGEGGVGEVTNALAAGTDVRAVFAATVIRRIPLSQ